MVDFPASYVSLPEWKPNKSAHPICHRPRFTLGLHKRSGERTQPCAEKTNPDCWWLRNPVNWPVAVGSLSHYLQGFSTIPGSRGELSFFLFSIFAPEGGWLSAQDLSKDSNLYPETNNKKHLKIDGWKDYWEGVFVSEIFRKGNCRLPIPGS